MIDGQQHFRRQAFQSDPNLIPQQGIIGGAQIGPQGWVGQSTFSDMPAQQNLLTDPSFTSVVKTALTTAEQKISRELYAKYVLNSGTVSTVKLVDQITRLDKTNNSFDTSLLTLEMSGPASATNMTVYIYTKSNLTIGANRVNLDWLNAAIRAFRFNAPWNTTNLTTFTLTLELVNNIGGSPVVVQSVPLDLTTMGSGDFRQLVAQQNQPFTTNDTWDIRFNFSYVTTGSASTDLKIGLFAPQLHFAYTPDPNSFTSDGLAQQNPGVVARLLAPVTATGAGSRVQMLYFIIPANFMQVGMVFRLEAWGIYTTGATPGSPIFDLLLGPTTLTGVPVGYNTVQGYTGTALTWRVEVLVTIQGPLGSSCMSQGGTTVFLNTPGAGTADAIISNASTTPDGPFDTTVQNLLEFTINPNHSGASYTTTVATIEVAAMGV